MMTLLVLRNMVHLLKAGVGLLIAAFAAGCLDADKAIEANAVEEPRRPDPVPPLEHELVVPYFVSSTRAPVFVPPVQGETTWVVTVPDGARNVSLTSTWTPSTPAAQGQHCMVHVQEADKMGPVLVEKMGSSPLILPWTGIQDRTKNLAVMCMPVNDPVAVEAMQTIHLKFEFGRGDDV